MVVDVRVLRYEVGEVLMCLLPLVLFDMGSRAMNGLTVMGLCNIK